jgi:two-component system chemotaxis response regulator CheB
MKRGEKLGKIKVLIADDSALMRREIRRILESDPEIEVVAAAKNGKEAIELARKLCPDVIALDINMPVMDGLTALQNIVMELKIPVVMISSLTQEGAYTTYRALELGAVDFVGKPSGTISLDIDKLSVEIILKIKAASNANRNALGLKRFKQTIKQPPDKKERYIPTHSSVGKIVVIGESTGGPNAIMDILPAFPPDIGVPVLIVQHMPGTFTPSFAKRLDKNCAIDFKEAEDGDILKPNKGFLAPGGLQTIVTLEKESGEPVIKLSKEPRDLIYKPSVDITMKSVLKTFQGKNIIAVILTGMGADGADAMLEIRKAGGRTIVESEETCVVFGMPRETIKRGGAEFILPSYKIGEKIVELVKCNYQKGDECPI